MKGTNLSFPHEPNFENVRTSGALHGIISVVPFSMVIASTLFKYILRMGGESVSESSIFFSN